MSILPPSVQSLFIQMRFSGQNIASGTGFIVNAPRGPMLITNRHNVTGLNNDTGQPLSTTGAIPNEILIVHNRTGQLCQWVTRVEPLINADGPLWIEHPTLKSSADFVALPLTQLNDVQIYPYNIGADPKILVAPSDTISVIGFPFGNTGGGALGIWATGFVATEPAVDYNGLPTFLIDCRARRGQSGSAVVAHRNGGSVAMEGGTAIFSGPVTRFLGIYSGRINSESDLGIVWKANAIKALVDSIV